MHITHFVTALAGLSAVAEAGILNRHSSPYSRMVARRQFGGGFNGGNRRFRGGGGGGFGDNNNNDNNNNDSNNDGNNGDNNNDGNNNDGNNDNDNNNGDNNNSDNNNNDGGNNDGGNNGNDGGVNTCLVPELIQQGSNQPGQPGEGGVESAVDAANFINFCQGQELTNGEQKTGGSCNGIPMGRIPAQNRMVSSILVNPSHDDSIEPNVDFDIQVRVANFAPGAFTDAQTTYYSSPQDLDGAGRIIGHTHVTVQDLGGSLTPDQPLDASTFVFFKGINDQGDGNGLLSATVTGGLPPGNYRVCTMFAAANHQPVIMPVAQRGAQDDCNKFTVGQGNNNGGGNNNNNDGGNNNNNGGDNNNDGGNNNNDGGDDNNDDGDDNDGGDNNNGGDDNNGGGDDTNGVDDNNDGGDDTNGGGDNNDGGDNTNGGGDNNDGDNNNGGGFPNFGGGGGRFNGGNNNNSNGGGNNNSGGGGSGGASAANAIAGIAAPEITQSGNGDRPFQVNGNTFTDQQTAAVRACDIQSNLCSDAVNGGQAPGSTLQSCRDQIPACVAELS